MDVVNIIAMFASIIAAVYAVRNDKGHIRKCIRKKEREINDLLSQKERKYNNTFLGGTITPEDEKILKLKQQIADLEDRL